MVAPTATYSRATHIWSKGSVVTTFAYKRGDGRVFVLSAAPASSQTSPPSKYLFEDDGVDRAGNPVLVKHERFVWRNGNQLMTVIAGSGISSSEIVAIRSAMHGTPVLGVWPPQNGADEVMMRLPPR